MESDPLIRGTANGSVCGDANYDWGRIGSGRLFIFIPEGTGWFTRFFSDLLGMKTVARRCKKCGNIQIFTVD